MASRRDKKRRQMAAMMIRLREQHGRRSTPQPHQQRVVEKLAGKHPRLLAFHQLGSGKTYTALLAADQTLKAEPKSNTLFITPAGLTKNIEREQKKHGIRLSKSRVETLSYERAVKRINDLSAKPHALIVADEAHRLRNIDTKRSETLTPLLKASDKMLMLSGSPLYNRPTDLSALVNILARDKVLPDKSSAFNEQYISEKVVYPSWKQRLVYGVEPTRTQFLKDTKHLQKVFRQYVDYHEPGVTERKQYPEVTETTIRVPLPTDQQNVYHYIEETTLPRALRNRIRLNMPPDKRTNANLNVFASGIRQVSNSTRPFQIKPELQRHEKINRAVKSLVEKSNSDPNFRGLVYSNYLDAGVNPYREQLIAQKMPHAVITGKLSAKEREEVVKKYNSGQIKVLLVSSAGGEGFDLKGTKLIQILDPHWNEEKINQIIGRGVRYKSHSHLPPKQRQVVVEHYLSTIKPTVTDRLMRLKPTSIDEYLYNLSKSKGQIHHQLKDLIRGG